MNYHVSGEKLFPILISGNELCRILVFCCQLGSPLPNEPSICRLGSQASQSGHFSLAELGL